MNLTKAEKNYSHVKKGLALRFGVRSFMFTYLIRNLPFELTANLYRASLMNPSHFLFPSMAAQRHIGPKLKVVRQNLPILGRFCELNWRFLQFLKAIQLPMLWGVRACPLRKILNFSSLEMAF